MNRRFHYILQCIICSLKLQCISAERIRKYNITASFIILSVNVYDIIWVSQVPCLRQLSWFQSFCLQKGSHNNSFPSRSLIIRILLCSISLFTILIFDTGNQPFHRPHTLVCGMQRLFCFSLSALSPIWLASASPHLSK